MLHLSTSLLRNFMPRVSIFSAILINAGYTVSEIILVHLNCNNEDDLFISGDSIFNVNYRLLCPTVNASNSCILAKVSLGSVNSSSSQRNLSYINYIQCSYITVNFRF